ncbi:MAG: hypothetical protein WC346_12655 [Methanogenium sp.]|jgi:hypothetical protein
MSSIIISTLQQIKWSLDLITLKKMGISALLLIGGALLTYVSDNLLQLITAVGIPDAYMPLALASFTWLINAVREIIKGK